jgi:hypothetical protein
MRRVLLPLALSLLGACAPITSFQRQIENHRAPGIYSLPSFTSPACDKLAAHLEQVTFHIGLALIYNDTGDYGATDGTTSIWLRPDLASNSCGRAEVLAHELGHVFQPLALTKRERQVFADGVSWEVIRRSAGYDPRDRYAKYLATIKVDARILAVHRREIESVALMLLGGLK